MTTRTPLLAGNWKMYCTAEEAEALVDALLPMIAGIDDREIVVAPPFTALAVVESRLRGSQVFLAAQNVHWELRGAFTGEISPPMLRAAGCRYVIIGHSERRQLFGERDDSVQRKTAAALQAGLAPILCVGETLDEREHGRTLSVVERQTRAALEGLDPGALAGLVLAYEPVWAIGTGKVATPAQAEEVHAALRALLASMVGARVAAETRILYGGSVKPDNIDVLMREPDIDGALVGGASLQAGDFARIVRFLA